MKEFVLKCIQKDDDNIELSMSNDGFNGMEIMAILETKKFDLIEQVTHPEKFTYRREYKDTDGSTIIKEDTNGTNT